MMPSQSGPADFVAMRKALRFILLLDGTTTTMRSVIRTFDNVRQLEVGG
jgi:hypothetical protein